MTMISPEAYIERMEGKSYQELISEREDLITYICEFEKAELSGGTVEQERRMGHSSAQVMYQVYLEYLSALCRFMHDKYNQEYVWGGRTLKKDADECREKKAGTMDTKKAEQDFNTTLEVLKGICRPESK